MPRPTLPPTPGSSTDIKGREAPQLALTQMTFELPPPALLSDSRPSSVETKCSSTSSYHPASPKSKAAATSSRRRLSAAQAGSAKDSFTLPPPPTRSRKIIQMKPRAQQEEVLEAEAPRLSAAKTSATTAPKKKQPTATSVAGRKIARKTAHSLIERRRRSKMNEEFGVLKSMIPACTGEMHKLAILQASIDYVRYLEDCILQLKGQNGRSTPTPTSHDELRGPPGLRDAYNGGGQYGSYEDREDLDDDNDVQMTGSEQASPAFAGISAHPHQPSVSPVLLAQDALLQQRHHSVSSASAAGSFDHRHYSYSTAASATTSPAFGPQAHSYEYAMSTTSGGSALTSPALGPMKTVGSERDLDQEATAALLMLNTDRRGTSVSINGNGRGMSVQDMLSG